MILDNVRIYALLPIIIFIRYPCLREAMKFMAHDYDCAASITKRVLGVGDGVCTCGLTDLLARVERGEL